MGGGGGQRGLKPTIQASLAVKSTFHTLTYTKSKSTHTKFKNEEGKPQNTTFNPIRPGLFSRSPDLKGGGGGGLRGPDAKNQGYHQPIEIKLCMSYHSPKSIPDAKFKADSPSSFGDITSQNFPRKKGTSHQIRQFNPGIRVQL